MNVVRDPGITHGRFRVLARTDGHFVVVDPWQPLGRGTVAGPFVKVGEADREARRRGLALPSALEVGDRSR